MIRPVLKYGAEELVKVSSPVVAYDDDLRVLIRDLADTMYAERGVGLAAPQVGVNLRVIVVDVRTAEEEGERLELVNPQIISSQGRENGEEGCLSIPGFTAPVERPQKIEVKASDAEGRDLHFEAEDMLARVICHEVDHLDGVLYLDRISFLRRDVIRRKIKKLVKAGEWV